MQWVDFSQAVEISAPVRERFAQDAIKKLQELPFDSRNHRFTYFHTGDTMIVASQFKGEDIRLWDCKVRQVGYVSTK